MASLTAIVGSSVIPSDLRDHLQKPQFIRNKILSSRPTVAIMLSCSQGVPAHLETALRGFLKMKYVLAAVLTFATIASSFAISISSEVERGFRYFKYNSDFELQRLVFKSFQNTHGGQKPSIYQIDEMLGSIDWWYNPMDQKTAAWYGHNQAPRPIDLLEEWRKQEIAEEQRAPGYLELSRILRAKGMTEWEYDPVRMGWASLLFPAHQSPSDLGNVKLINSERVAVCWNRGEQSHTNCGGLNTYLVPNGHNVFVRAIDGADTRLLSGQCSWEIDSANGAKFIRPKNVTGPQVQLACSDEVLIFIPTGKEVKVKLERSADSAEIVVKIGDQLVVGFGDSFSSGEGNPDVPAKLAWTSDNNQDWAADGTSIVDETTNGPIRKAAGDYFAAQWIDRSCHRSAYSYQLRSALYLAVQYPYAITFLNYACSGAEVNGGLFYPLQGPEYTSNKASMDAFRKAQIPSLLNELCEKYDGDDVRDTPLSAAEEIKAIASGRYKFGGVISDRAYRCANQPAGKGLKRPIDLLYVSIGGNDMGFSRWIMAAITAEGKLGSFFPILKEDTDSACKNHQLSCRETRRRWKTLGARFALLRDFIDNRLAFTRGLAPVLLFTYPLPVRDTNGDYCPAGNSGMTVFVGRPSAPEPVKVCLSRTQKGLDTLDTIVDFTENSLNKAIENLASPDGYRRPAWQAVTAYKSEFDDRGFCASKVKEASGGSAPDEPFAGCKTASQIATLVKTLSFSGPAVQETLHLPSGFPTPTGNWRPFDPVLDYMPYAHRSRLLRTMNETDFLVNKLDSAVQGSKASGFLSLKDAAVYGAFHPTGEAHAFVADEFFAKSEDILNRSR
jgi:hypothetical protein